MRNRRLLTGDSHNAPIAPNGGGAGGSQRGDLRPYVRANPKSHFDAPPGQFRSGGQWIWFAITDGSFIWRYSRSGSTRGRIDRMHYKRFVNCREAWPNTVVFRQISPSIAEPLGSGPALLNFADRRPIFPNIARDCPTSPYPAKSRQSLSSSAESRQTFRI